MAAEVHYVEETMSIIVCWVNRRSRQRLWLLNAAGRRDTVAYRDVVAWHGAASPFEAVIAQLEHIDKVFRSMD